MNLHFAKSQRMAGRTSLTLRLPVLAVLCLLAVLTSLVPCEAISQLGGEPQVAEAPVEQPSSPSGESSSGCPDNCPCLCAGSCSGALASEAVALVMSSERLQASPAANNLFARLIPDRLFHPPRLYFVV